jgi:hypothetical protein
MWWLRYIGSVSGRVKPGKREGENPEFRIQNPGGERGFRLLLPDS